ncbi:hypothetical protein HAX54_015313 [Datura stramonium]|uniref:Uncharacterized protein n=1 Tax=Datura stramonium TaxID=4076 RepID=A0ABS8TR97_DATST|nr:hypothetical protein [Datura stramonium]
MPRCLLLTVGGVTTTRVCSPSLALAHRSRSPLGNGSATSLSAKWRPMAVGTPIPNSPRRSAIALASKQYVLIVSFSHLCEAMTLRLYGPITPLGLSGLRGSSPPGLRVRGDRGSTFNGSSSIMSPKFSSPVWKYFEVVQNNERRQALRAAAEKEEGGKPCCGLLLKHHMVGAVFLLGTMMGELQAEPVGCNNFQENLTDRNNWNLLRKHIKCSPSVPMTPHPNCCNGFAITGAVNRPHSMVSLKQIALLCCSQSPESTRSSQYPTLSGTPGLIGRKTPMDRVEYKVVEMVPWNTCFFFGF